MVGCDGTISPTELSLCVCTLELESFQEQLQLAATALASGQFDALEARLLEATKTLERSRAQLHLTRVCDAYRPEKLGVAVSAASSDDGYSSACNTDPATSVSSDSDPCELKDGTATRVRGADWMSPSWRSSSRSSGSKLASSRSASSMTTLAPLAEQGGSSSCSFSDADPCDTDIERTCEDIRFHLRLLASLPQEAALRRCNLAALRLHRCGTGGLQRSKVLRAP